MSRKDGVNILLIKISALLKFFFISALIMIPFDGLSWSEGIFGELSLMGYFYPVCIGMILFYYFAFIKKIECKIPKDITFYLLIAFIGYVFVSGLINFSEISYNYTKGRSGLARFLSQYILFLFYLMLSIFLYNIISKCENIFYFIFKGLKFSFCLVGIYVAFEIAFLFDNQIANNILKFIDPFIHTVSIDLKSGEGFQYRLRGLSYEPSTLGIYIGFIFPWFVSFYCIIKKKMGGVLLIAYLFLIVLLSTSRIAYFIIFIESILIFVLFYREIFAGFLSLKNILITIGIGVVFCFSYLYINDQYEWISISRVAFSFSGETGFDMSNIARFGAQLAGLGIFLDHPFVGVGLAQYAFHMPAYVPDWAFISGEIQDWADNAPNTAWASVFSLYIRILSELGIIGFLMWMSIWTSIMYQLIRNINKFSADDKIFVKTLIITLTGVLLSGFNFDTFRFFEIWLVLPLCWYVIEKAKTSKKLTG